MYIAFYYKDQKENINLYLRISKLNTIECVNVYPHKLLISDTINIYKDGSLYVYESNSGNTLIISNEESIKKLSTHLKETNILFVCFSSNINIHTAVNIIEHISILLKNHNLQKIHN